MFVIVKTNYSLGDFKMIHHSKSSRSIYFFYIQWFLLFFFFIILDHVTITSLSLSLSSLELLPNIHLFSLSNTKLFYLIEQIKVKQNQDFSVHIMLPIIDNFVFSFCFSHNWKHQNFHLFFSYKWNIWIVLWDSHSVALLL